jgi:hypothetical protein
MFAQKPRREVADFAVVIDDEDMGGSLVHDVNISGVFR